MFVLIVIRYNRDRYNRDRYQRVTVFQAEKKILEPKRSETEILIMSSCDFTNQILFSCEWRSFAKIEMLDLTTFKLFLILNCK